jgi:hypothetical protein
MKNDYGTENQRSGPKGAVEPVKENITQLALVKSCALPVVIEYSLGTIDHVVAVQGSRRPTPYTFNLIQF